MKRGAENKAWRGGVSSVSYRLRRGYKFREWREAVFERDNWTCQECGERGGVLHPHHIKAFSTIMQEIRRTCDPEDLFTTALENAQLWDVSNGVTLCKECHHKTDNYGVNIVKY